MHWRLPLTPALGARLRVLLDLTAAISYAFSHAFLPSCLPLQRWGKPVVPNTTHNEMVAATPGCLALINQCNAANNGSCASAYYDCNLGIISPFQATGLSPYDVTQECTYPPLCELCGARQTQIQRQSLSLGCMHLPSGLSRGKTNAHGVALHGLPSAYELLHPFPPFSRDPSSRPSLVYGGAPALSATAGTYTGGMTRFLNTPAVQHELGVELVLWLPCNPIVSEFFMADWPHNFEQDLTPLLDGGLDVLMYYGDDDFSE